MRAPAPAWLMAAVTLTAVVSLLSQMWRHIAGVKTEKKDDEDDGWCMTIKQRRCTVGIAGDMAQKKQERIHL